MSKRKKKEPTEYEKLLYDYHSRSDRHVLVCETDLSYEDKCHVFHTADLIRKAGNELTAIMKHNYEQLMRTKKYRKLRQLYGKHIKDEDDAIRKHIARQMKEIQDQYNVTWDFCRNAMIPIKNKYGIKAVFALSKAEDIWSGVEECLYSDGKQMHFKKRGDLPEVRAKQINKGIILSFEDEKLRFKLDKMSFGIKVKDRFQQDEISAILDYLSAPELNDAKAVSILVNEGTCISTYRPCYVSLKCKRIRGKLRVYAHITIEGLPKPKYDRNGNPRHHYGTGTIGCDIGTQTIAYNSDFEVGLKNLAERGRSIQQNERMERRIYRAMDRSRRAMNPDNYNEDGTVKKGKKKWKNSNRYKRLREKHAELCRINAENRHYAINEDVNHLRSLGDVFVTEPKNAKKLQKRAKETTVNEEGKYNRKKRFGKSIQNRCCGYFQEQVKQKFTRTGGIYIEVPNDYRASQYDHTADDYIKKKLSDRMHRLSDGTLVQRDWYSAFLLSCIDIVTMTIDKEKCKNDFSKQYNKEKAMIGWIMTNNIKVLNSGIKVA